MHVAFIVDCSVHFHPNLPTADITITKVDRDSGLPEPSPVGMVNQVALIGEVQEAISKDQVVIVTYHLYGSPSFSGSMRGAAHIEYMTKKTTKKRPLEHVA